MQTKLVPTLIAAAVLTIPGTASATDGHFLHGVGAINSAMGGAGVAAPTSLLGTYYLNPAGLMAFDGTRAEFGFELFKADRTVASTFEPASMSGSTTTDGFALPSEGQIMNPDGSVDGFGPAASRSPRPITRLWRTRVRAH